MQQPILPFRGAIVTEIPPVVYLLHGEDEFGIAQVVSELEANLGDTATAARNMARLDGRSVPLEDIHLAAAALPFLADRRLVILYHPLARLNGTQLQEKFLALLDSLPRTTRLVLVEYRTLSEAQKGKPPKVHWLLKWAEQAGPRAYIKSFSLQKGSAMARWIQEQARLAGGQFTPQAAALLATLVGDDTRLAFSEIQKLIAFSNYSRAVQPEDVENLTAYAGQSDIFAMVDALGSQNGRNALKMLHRLLEDQEALSIFGMVVRQFRLLLLAREILDLGGRESEVARELKIHPFVAEKITAQARHFSSADLENVYYRLLDIDEAVKSGQVEGDVALDTFVAAFTAQ
jgi:DNA polymerase-3 subunit delta